MANVILYIAVSLDGYIARVDGGVDWLNGFTMPGEDYGYAAFYKSVDCIVMGSRTYQQVLDFGDWPYPGKMSIVFTHRESRTDREDIEFSSGDVELILQNIKARGYDSIWLLGGGYLVRAFMTKGLVDEYIISIIPLILGEGIALFNPVKLEERLEFVEALTFPDGLVQLHYKRARQ